MTRRAIIIGLEQKVDVLAARAPEVVARRPIIRIVARKVHRLLQASGVLSMDLTKPPGSSTWYSVRSTMTRPWGVTGSAPPQ